MTTINASNRTLLPYLGTSSGIASSGQWGYTRPQYREVASTILDAMDDRVLLVEPENRARLSELLEKGDPQVDQAFLAYQAHRQWVRRVHRDGSIPPEKVPTFTESEAGKQLTAQPSHGLIALAASLMADKVMRVRRIGTICPHDRLGSPHRAPSQSAGYAQTALPAGRCRRSDRSGLCLS